LALIDLRRNVNLILQKAKLFTLKPEYKGHNSAKIIDAAEVKIARKMCQLYWTSKLVSKSRLLVTDGKDIHKFPPHAFDLSKTGARFCLTKSIGRGANCRSRHRPLLESVGSRLLGVGLGSRAGLGSRG
jgi:hypothetical protein